MKYYNYLHHTVLLLLTATMTISCSSDKNTSDSNFTENKLSARLTTLNFGDVDVNFQLPKNWFEVDSMRAESFRVFVATCHDTVKFCPNLNVRYLKNIDEGLVEATETYAGLMQQKHGQNFELKSVQEKEFNNHEAIDIDYKLFLRDTHLGGSTSIIQVKNNEVIIFSYMAENTKDGGYAIYRKLYSDLMSTVEFSKD